MNEAHLEARAPDRSPADPSAGQDHFVLREDLRRVSVPIDQFGSWRMHGLSCALLVVLPVLCAYVYYGLIAAGKYSVEFRFSVRSATELVADEDNIALMIKGGKSGTREIGLSPTWPRTTYEAAMLSGNSIGTVGCGRYFRGIKRIGCRASIHRRATTISGIIGGK